VDNLPEDYVTWLFWNVDMREPLKSHVTRVFYRITEGNNPAPMAEPDQGRVHSVYRRLAFKWHPDRGGTTEAMQAVNEFYEELNKGD
jgi:hypothetical protein